MAEFDVGIVNLFREKVRLYGELLEIFEQEKKSLFEADTDAIWRFSNQKQMLAREIEEIRGKILVLLNEASINHGMRAASFRASTVVKRVPEALSRELAAIHRQLNKIKDAVHQAAKLNKAFVEEYLGFIRDFVDTIASVRRPKAVYTNRRYMKDAGNRSMLLNREV